MRFVGIDPSLSNTGMAVIDGEKPTLFSLSSSHKLSPYRRQRNLVAQVKENLRRNDIVVFEDFGVSARFAPSGRYCERIELLGMLKLICPAVTRLPWLSVAPTMLKSFLSGKAAAHKTEMVEAAIKIWGVEPANDDEADAFGLARFGKAMLNEEEKHKKRLAKFENYGMNREHLAILRFSVPGIGGKSLQVL